MLDPGVRVAFAEVVSSLLRWLEKRAQQRRAQVGAWAAARELKLSARAVNTRPASRHIATPGSWRHTVVNAARAPLSWPACLLCGSLGFLFSSWSSLLLLLLPLLLLLLLLFPQLFWPSSGRAAPLQGAKLARSQERSSPRAG